MKQGPVVVVGGSNVDIGGKPDQLLIEGDSNPGRVRITLGGVGHNIARNLRLLGLDTVFLTAIGKDVYGERILQECAASGIDGSRILELKDCTTSTYLFIADREGDMRLAISDMAICDRITPDYLTENLDLLNRAAAVVMDANLPEESIRYLAKNCSVPLFADPVSASKAGRLKPILSRLHALKPNRLEAELLSGLPIRSREDLPAAAEKLLGTGLKELYISLGSKVVYAVSAEQSCLIPRCWAEVRNTTGAGDAFTAGLVWAYLQDKTLLESARIAAAAAAIAAEGRETINPNLSPVLLQEKLAQENGS